MSNKKDIRHLVWPTLNSGSFKLVSGVVLNDKEQRIGTIKPTEEQKEDA